MNLDKSIEKYGLTGDGVNILMIDHEFVRNDYTNYLDIPYPGKIRNVHNQRCYVTTNSSVLPPITDSNHGNHVAMHLQKVVPDVNIYSTHFQSYSDMEWAIENKDIDIINASIDQGVASYDEAYVAKWYDALVSTYGIPAIIASGNHVLTSTTWVNSPSCGYNSISVGAYKMPTNQMYNFRYNPLDENNVVRYKPDLIAAADSTSVATPRVTGIVAMITQMDSSITSNPALVKAILMASCHEKALRNDLDSDPQENMSSGLTKKQGAGKIDAYKALGIVLMGTYGTGSISDSSKTVTSIALQNNNNVNVSLAWLRHNIFPDELGPGYENNHNTTLGNLHELTLQVYNNETLINNSSISNSGKQLAYFSATKDLQYNIRITKVSTYEESVGYAYAWSTSFQKELESVQMNGKVAKNQQLSVDAICNDGATATANEVDYQWQSSADGSTWADINGATSNVYTLTAQEFLKYVRCQVSTKDTSLLLPCSLIAVSDNKVIIFGDSDLNGIINTRDATAIYRYIDEEIDFSEEQIIAADVDGDGEITEADATLIQQYAASVITTFPVEQ